MESTTKVEVPIPGSTYVQMILNFGVLILAERYDWRRLLGEVTAKICSKPAANLTVEHKVRLCYNQGQLIVASSREYSRDSNQRDALSGRTIELAS